MALFGEEGPLRIEVPGWTAEIAFSNFDQAGFAANGVIARQGAEYEVSAIGATPSDVVMQLGDVIGGEVIRFANQLPLD